jgi:hypothetical protein
VEIRLLLVLLVWATIGTINNLLAEFSVSVNNSLIYNSNTSGQSAVRETTSASPILNVFIEPVWSTVDDKMTAMRFAPTRHLSGNLHGFEMKMV